MKNAEAGHIPQKTEEISIPVPGVKLQGDLQIPQNARGLVIFAHGSGSGRKSPRNHYASVLNEAGIATLLFDLLTEREEAEDMYTGHLRFDIKMLADRLAAVAEQILSNRWINGQRIGYFGSSTGAAAAIIAAVKLGNMVDAIVSRGGRLDLAEGFLERIKAPTLLIVGGYDYEVIRLNREAFHKIKAVKEMVIVPGATHLFEEAGTLEIAAKTATDWFSKYLNTETGTS